MASIVSSSKPRALLDLQCCEKTNWLPAAQPARIWPSSRSTGSSVRFGLWYSAKPWTACSNTSGTSAKTVHQSPGDPVHVPGSDTGSRPSNRKSYIEATKGAVASSFGTCRSRGMNRTSDLDPGCRRSWRMGDVTVTEDSGPTGEFEQYPVRILEID